MGMLSGRSKASFYMLFGPIMRVNGAVHRRFRGRNLQDLRVHLGPGKRNYIRGWINVDANMFTGKCDIWADLRKPLAFSENSVSAAYSHHVIEHLPNIETHLREVFRCLAPGGAYRVCGPSGDGAITKFLANDLHWFPIFPDERTSIGGRLENFLMCRGEHLTILTFSYLEEVMSRIGFTDVSMSKPALESKYMDLFAECLAYESETDFDTPHTLVVEGVKPLFPEAA
jgi:predicted SAM-dependent methyltransferase